MFRSKILFVAVLLLSFVCVPKNSDAAIITFDDIDAKGDFVLISNGYAGFNWNNFYALDPTRYPSASGYNNGRVSPINVGFNGNEKLASFSSPTMPFTLTGGYFAAAWYNETFTITGYLNGTQVYQGTYDIVTTGPTYIALNWSNVDSVSFIGNGTGAYTTNSHVVVDNLVINENVVPLPAALPLFFSGLAVVAGVGRRRRRA